jgi:hypothetical protein
MSGVNPKHLIVYVVALCLVLGVSFVMGRMNGLVFGGMFGGQVLDQDTGKPVEGAYVIATWEDYTLSQTTCVHMDIQVTDSEGSYFFGPWIDFVGRVVFRQNAPRRMVYAPGYEKVNYGDPTYVRRHHDKPKERIKELRRIEAQFCGRASLRSEQLVHRIYRDMYFEAEPLLHLIAHDPKNMYKLRVQAMKNGCGRLCL